MCRFYIKFLKIWGNHSDRVPSLPPSTKLRGERSSMTRAIPFIDQLGPASRSGEDTHARHHGMEFLLL